MENTEKKFLDREQALIVKEMHFKNLNFAYQNLLEVIKQLPGNFKMHAMVNLDQGMMWLEKGIVLHQIEIKPFPPTDPVGTVKREIITNDAA